MDSGRLITTLGFCKDVIKKLLSRDLMYDTDICSLAPEELSEELGIDIKDSEEIIQVASSKSVAPSKTALDILSKEDVSIVTFCEGLDNLLGGGLPVGSVTQFSGQPGIGKTQLCLQLCISVQLPGSVGGLDGEAVYIDTEGSFSVRRLKEIATHTIHYLKNMDGLECDFQAFTVESILERIHWFRCHTLIDVMATVRRIRTLLKESRKVKLIILDSIAVTIQPHILSFKAHQALQSRIVRKILDISIADGMGVVIINHLGDPHLESAEPFEVDCEEKEDFSAQRRTKNAVFDPYNSWDYCLNIKATLDMQNGVRYAKLTKAPFEYNSLAKYQVTAAGIRDVEEESPSLSCFDSDLHSSRKRKLEDLGY